MTSKTTTKPAKIATPKSKVTRPKTVTVKKAMTAVEPAAVEPEGRAPRPDTKQAKMIAMLKGGGATIEEMATALDWQPHTVRGALAGALRKRLGLDVGSEKVEGRGRVYRLAG